MQDFYAMQSSWQDYSIREYTYITYIRYSTRTLVIEQFANFAETIGKFLKMTKGNTYDVINNVFCNIS